MKTQQIMKRKFLDGTVEQNHKTQWFNATDFLKIANTYRKQIKLKEKKMNDYLKTDSTKEFVKKILDEEEISKAYSVKKGRYGGTWMHPFLFIDFVMWVSPDFKYYAIKWLNDELLKNRDTSGDSYRRLSSAVVEHQKKIGAGEIALAMKKIARKIKTSLDVEDWNSTDDEKLKNRDEIHKSLIILIKAGVDIDKALEIAIKEIQNGKN